ncbi:MAG: hypothetical protein J6T35_03685, partial [Bacteroidales bacterium]|nr:hypothetical protein [Bacteroidales bacterium]
MLALLRIPRPLAAGPLQSFDTQLPALRADVAVSVIVLPVSKLPVRPITKTAGCEQPAVYQV